MYHSKLFVILHSCTRPPLKWGRCTVHHYGVSGFKKCCISKRFSSRSADGINDQGIDSCTNVVNSFDAFSTTANFSLTVENNSSSTPNDDSTLLASKTNAAKLTEDEILNFIAYSNRMPVVSDTLLSVVTHLENECIGRARKWDIETLMNFYKRYHQIGFIKHSKFPTYALRSRCKYVFNRCSLPVILEFLHLINGTITGRNTQFNKYDVEYVLNKHLDVLQPNQVALFIHLLSSSGKNLRNDNLKKNLCLWFVSQAQTLPQDVVKGFTLLFAGRDSTNPLFITPWFVRVLKAIDGRLHEFDLSCLSSVALTCSHRMIIDEDILEKIASKLVNELPSANLQDIESIVEALVSLNFHSRTCDLYNELVRQMHEKPLYDELRTEPRRLCRILTQLSFIDIYPYRLLSLNFSKGCLERGYKSLSKYNVPYEIRMLLGGLRIERPDYRDCKVGFNLIRYHTRKHRLNFPKVLRSCEPMEIRESSEKCRLISPRELSPYNRLLYSARDLLNQIFGSTEYTHICFILPHSSRANILFVTNKIKEPQKLLPNVRSNLLLKYKDLDWSNFEYYVVVFLSKNIYMDYEPILMGEEIAKTRQLQKLGFKIIFSTQHGWLKADFKETITMLKKTLQKEGVVLRSRE